MQRLVVFTTFTVLITSILASAETIIPGGPVSGTWDLAGSPYLVEGEITLNSNQTLTIDPGVEVLFQGWYKFIVEGILLAVGTEEDSILFTATDTTRGWHGLRFYDLSTQPDSSKLVYCKVTYGRSSSDNSANTDKHGGVIFALNSDKLTIAHCLIEHNMTGNVLGSAGPNGSAGTTEPGGPGEDAYSGHGGAIFIASSDILLTCNTIIYNQTGSSRGGRGGDAGDIELIYGGPIFGGTGGSGGRGESGCGSALYLYQSSATIANNKFAFNICGEGIGGNGGAGGDVTDNSWSPDPYGGVGGAGGDGLGGTSALFIDQSDALLSNNLIYNNLNGDAFGGSGGNGGDGWGFDPYWCGHGGSGGTGGNGFGGNGIACSMDGCSPVILSHTISLNELGLAYPGVGGAGGSGGGVSGSAGQNGASVMGEYVVYITGTSQPDISNSIVWDNEDARINGAPDITYSCIEDGYPGTGNIDSDPLFVGNVVGDYFLSQILSGQPSQSPCVDVGDPNSIMVEGTTRTDGYPDEGVIDMGFHYSEFENISVLDVSVDSLFFEAAIGGANPTDQIFQISNSNVGYFTFTIEENADWLTVLPSSGGPVPPSADITVAVDITGLVIGTYEEDIIITADGAQGSPDTLRVLLTIGESSLLVSEDSLNFTAGYGGLNPPDQFIDIDNQGPGTLFYSIEENISWLTVSPDSGGPIPPTERLTVSVDISDLQIGAYEGDIFVLAPASIGSPDTVHIELTVGDMFVVFEPEDLAFIAAHNGNTPPPQFLAINNSGFGWFDYAIRDDIPWLSVNPMSGGPVPPTDTLQLDVNIQGLSPGIYQDTLFVEVTGTPPGQFPIPITLNVLEAFQGPINGVIEAGNYAITNHLSVQGGESLTMEAGTAFMFDGDYQFVVYGSLQAEGNEQDSVKFIPLNPEVDWQGLEFNSAVADSSELTYCVIRGSQEGGIYCHGDGALQANNCSVEYNTNSDGGGGIRIVSNNPVFNSCRISQNSSTESGGGILILSDSSPVFNHCIIDSNTVYGEFSSAVYMGGGMRVESVTANPIFNHCLFSHNQVIWGQYCEGGGIWLGLENGGNFTNCSIISNSAIEGAGVYSFGSEAHFENCIIADNQNYGFQNAVNGYLADVSYCDFWENAGGNFVGYNPYNIGMLSQINVNGDSCDVYHNIFMDPLFYSTSGDSAYRLTDLSPCIDAGDPTSPLDPDSTIADIGAYYFYHEMGLSQERSIEIPDEFCLFPAYPNPFNPSTTIRFGLPVTSQVSLAVYNIRGERVADLVNGFRLAGYHNVTWDAGGLASGMFFAVIHAGDFQAIRKVMLVK